jgi:hypothetical protein
MSLVQFWLARHQMESFLYSPSKVHAHSVTADARLINVRAQMMVNGALTFLMVMPSVATLFLGRPRHSLDR